MGDLKNEFGWSASRGRLLKKCKRAYWFRYYGSWGGWNRGAHPGRRITYRLGKMNSLVPWSGNLAHDVFEWAGKRISKGLPVSQAEMTARARAAMVKGWKEALGTAWATRPKQNINLSETYYDGNTEQTREKSRDAWARVETAISNWFDMGWPEVLAGIKRDDWVELEGRSTISFRGQVTVYVQPDLAYRDGVLWVVDWKTGRYKEADEEQIAIYVIWAIKTGKAKLEDIRTMLVYLGAEPREVKGSFDVHALKVFADDLWAGIQEVVELLEGRDIKRNEALPANFPKTTNERECKWCEYRQLCHGTRGPGAMRAGDPAIIEPPENWR